MRRRGGIEQPDLPPGPLRDFNTAMFDLFRRAGRPSVREMAADTGLAPATVNNIFIKPERLNRDTAMAVAGCLAVRRRWESGVDPEQAMDEVLNRLDQLWQRAWEAQSPGCPPTLLRATTELLHGLSPECTLCRQAGNPLGIAPIPDWASARDLELGPPGPDGTPSVSYSYDPWRMLVLCEHCQQRQHADAVTEQELRAARTALDSRLGAAQHYARFIDNFLTETQSFSSKILFPALGIVRADPTTHTAPYVVDGKFKIDRSQGRVTMGRDVMS